jgi:hypothetical protein
VPENPDTYGALLGTYRGAFDEVNLRPLYDSQGAEIQTMRRWLSASVSAGNVVSNFAVVDTGRGFNAYFYAVDLSTGRTIVSKSAICCLIGRVPEPRRCSAAPTSS